MNKEMKLSLSVQGFLDLKILPLIQDYIKERENKAYLQGAKDAIEAVKIRKISNKTYITSDISAYNEAIEKMDSKAQQFIDSLKQNDTTTENR